MQIVSNLHTYIKIRFNVYRHVRISILLVESLIIYYIVLVLYYNGLNCFILLNTQFTNVMNEMRILYKYSNKFTVSVLTVMYNICITYYIVYIYYH